MGKGVIELRDHAFEEILRTAVETLKIEGTGLVFGKKFEKKNGLLWVVESAHPFQHADRSSTGCSVSDDGWRANWSILNDYIGGFHVHPTSRQQKEGIRKVTQGKVYFSGGDRKFLKDKEFIDKIELVVGIHPVSCPGNIQNSNLYIAAGYIPIGKRLYRTEVGGYYYHHGIKRAEIKVSKKMLGKLQNLDF